MCINPSNAHSNHEIDVIIIIPILLVRKLRLKRAKNLPFIRQSQNKSCL